MFRRVLFAWAVGAICTFASITNATLFRELATELPSSFGYASEDRNSGLTNNPATSELSEAASIFGPNEILRNSYGAVAGRYAGSPSNPIKPVSLEELIAIASVSPDYRIISDGNAIQRGNLAAPEDFQSPPDLAGRKVRDLAKALVNRHDPVQSSTPAVRPDQPNNRNGRYFSFVDAVLETELDREFVATVTDVVRPSVTPEGVVALNFMGIRDFAFIVSPETNKIQVVDFQTGATVTVHHNDEPQPVMTPPAANRLNAQRTPVRTQGESLTTIKLLLYARAFVLSPLTIGSVLLLSIFAVVFRIARSTAG